MRIAVLPADTGACGHSRLIWPADTVRTVRPEWDVRVYDPRTVRIDRANQTVHGLDVDGLDVLVTQRVGTRAVADLCTWVRARGAAVVMDMDDAMWCLDPDNTSYAGWNGERGGPGAHWERIDRVAAAADMVTVTTTALAQRYGRHGRVAVLPNRIPRMALGASKPGRRGNPPVAGWAGLLATHPHDPKAIGDALKLAVSRGLVQAGVMGDAYRTAKMWGTKVTAFRTANLGMDYYRHIAMFDIGLVPLDLEGSSAEFNAAKSSLKALEYAATGSAVIASPSPANVEFAREVPIRLAATPGEWLEHLTDLADEGARAAQVSAQTAALAAYGWAVQDRAEDWAQVWEHAAQNRKGTA